MTNQQPLVSIIIPCYNSAAWIGETLDSALAQTYRPLEIIVFNDGSTDDSLAIIERYAAQHPDLIRYASGPNGGLSSARNRGFALSRGECVLFLDADDLLSPDAIAGLVEAIQDKPNHIAICDWVRFVSTNGQIKILEEGKRFPIEGDLLRTFHSGGRIPVGSALWPCAVVTNSGGWDEQFSTIEDGDMFTRVLLSGVEVTHSVSGQMYYRDTPGSMSKQFGKSQIESYIRLAENFEHYLQARGLFSRYSDLLGRLFYDNALRLQILNEHHRAQSCYKRAIQIAGMKAISGPWHIRLLTYVLGIDAKEWIARRLAQLGIGRATRLRHLKRS